MITDADWNIARCSACGYRFTRTFVATRIGREKWWTLDVARAGKCCWCIRRFDS